jgi:hypothetical protein
MNDKLDRSSVEGHVHYMCNNPYYFASVSGMPFNEVNLLQYMDDMMLQLNWRKLIEPTGYRTGSKIAIEAARKRKARVASNMKMVKRRKTMSRIMADLQDRMNQLWG